MSVSSWFYYKTFLLFALFHDRNERLTPVHYKRLSLSLQQTGFTGSKQRAVSF